MIVLDTNVISEMMRPKPSPRVAAWFAKQSAQQLFTTAINQAEILNGVALLPKGRRRSGLSAAALAIFETDFAGRVLPFDAEAAVPYAEIAVAHRQSGKPIAQADAQIAAIARARGAALATRNGRDFAACGIALVDPWA